jgi:hypothetical protein
MQTDAGLQPEHVRDLFQFPAEVVVDVVGAPFTRIAVLEVD